MHASNAARYEYSLRDLADQAKIPGRNQPQVNIFRLICNWLRSEKSGKWLLILDNVDDASFLLDTPGSPPEDDAGASSSPQTVNAPLISYLPYCENGSILITTRSKRAARSLVSFRSMISVGPMDRDDALALMKMKLGDTEEPEDMEATAAIVLALECMPLAITQATSYIVQKRPRVSLKQYLEKLKSGNQEEAILLSHDGEALRRDIEADSSIILTWQISFDHIRHVRRSASNLLSFMSYFDSQGIPEDILRAFDSEKVSRFVDASSADTELFNDFDFGSNMNSLIEEDLQILLDYSFISVNEDKISFSMHRLVQLSVRTWLKSKSQEEQWEHVFIRGLRSWLSFPNPNNRKTYQVYLPHVQVAAQRRPKNENILHLWAFLYNAAAHLQVAGASDDAQILSEQALGALI